MKKEGKPFSFFLHPSSLIPHPSIDVGVGTEIFKDLLTLFFVNQQIDALTIVTSFQPSLGLEEQAVVRLPVDLAAFLAFQAEIFLAFGTQALQQFVFQRKEKLRTARIALASRTTGELAIDTARFVAFGAQDV